MTIRACETGAFVVCLFTLLLPSRPVFAHGIGAECRLQGNQLQVEAYFDDDTPARDAKVRVLDGRNREILSGKTDDRGVWTGDSPPPGDYHVIVDAGAGHRVKVRFTVPARDSDAGTVVSEGPDRRQLTPSRWLKAGIGIGVIFLLAMVFRAGMRRTSLRSAPSPDDSSPDAGN